MRALAFLLLVACKSEIEKVEWTPTPADRSTQLQGEDLEQFCRSQEREPGWTCDDFTNCTTEHQIGGSVECRSKS